MAAILISVFCSVLMTSTANVIQFHIAEELPVGTLVGSIALESGLSKTYTDDEISQIKFSFLDQTDMRTFFSIHETTGNIVIKGRIDRETECIFTVSCVMRFDVAVHASSLQLFEIFSVEITIEDLNDNSPTFAMESLTISVSESAMIGTALGLLEASDIDSTEINTIQSYELQNGMDLFTLDSKRNDGRFTLQLILNGKFDHENTDSYQLKLLSNDGGVPRRTGELTIFIDVIDENDNAPIFEQLSYALSINEDTPLQTPVLSVKAVDMDSGPNGEIIYKFNQRQQGLDRIKDIFRIDENTGIIYVTGEVKYDIKDNIFSIAVEASDKGKQPRTANTQVVITVMDTTNNKPSVHLNFLVPENNSLVVLSESAEVGTVIAHVTAADSDSGANGDVVCMITNEYVILQNISGKPGYLIVVNKRFDRETKEEHYISVTCSDNGSPKLSSSQSFMLHVLDENDNAPVFQEPTYFATVDENNPVGKYCLRVSATDADVWPNDNIRYVLKDDVHNAFSVGSSTGIITAVKMLDREKIEEYRLTVLAIDNGTPSLTGTTVVVVIVRDLNDNKPRFDVPFFQFFVKENSQSDLIVGAVKAYDSDSGDNKDISFSLVQNSGDNVPFAVNENGEIRAMDSFDREKETSHTFEIVATDKGTPSLSSKVFVRVYITDENDNSPSVTYPNSINNSVHVSYSESSGSYLTKIEAIDLDEDGPNSLLMYDLVAGNEDDMLTISMNSGKIFLKRQITTKPETRVITVNVKDNGVPLLETNVTFTMTLNFVDSSQVASYSVDDSKNNNVIIAIAVVSMTVIISGALIAIICVLRRSEQIRKKYIKEQEKKVTTIPQLYNEPDYKPKMEINVRENVSYQESVPEKEKEMFSSYDEDLDNMELYSSFGTSVFTDTLPGMEKPGQSMDDQRIMKRSSLKHVLSDDKISGIHSLDDISEISGEDNSDSGRGSSDPDLTRQSNFCYADRGLRKPKPALKNKSRQSGMYNRQSDNVQQKYYGFVDKPNTNYNTDTYPQDMKIVRFNEDGKFCVDTSSFV